MRNVTREIGGSPEQMGAALAAFEAGNISEAARLLDTLEESAGLTGYESRMRQQIEGWERMLHELPEIPSRQPRAYEAVPRTVLYVTASCQPFHVTGYSVRTQALLESVARTPWKAVCMARPGYPWDRWDALSRPERAIARSGDIEYRLARGASISAMPPDAYISTASVLIESEARQIRPAVIQAASNHMTALPSLIAARRLGIPFVYEVRGLWELFFGLDRPGWKRSERFRLARRLESLAARGADAVFTLTRQLSHELQERGVAASRIHLLPNGGDPQLLAAAALDRGLIAELELDPSVFTIGYAGALKSYEGLDDLLAAMARIRAAGKCMQAVIVGDGDHATALRARANELGLSDHVRFPGRLPPGQARALLHAADVAVLPRKRVDICEIVSPLKPFEIMALGVPLLMSNVAPLADIAAESGDACLLYDASSVGSLAVQLERLMDGHDLRREMTARAREFIAERGSWKQVGATMASALETLEAEAAARRRTLAGRVRKSLKRLRARLLRRPLEPLLIGSSDLFDAPWYLERYPDIARAGMNPFEHYLKFGAGEGRDPGPGFDTRWYLETNPDVARSGINPLVHYLLHGRNEGRTPKR